MKSFRHLASYALALCFVPFLFAERDVVFPPPESPHPPPALAPPNTENGSEVTDILPDPGPAPRNDQGRSPPPPTNLTVIYKLQYGETLQYTQADGTKQKFEQWKSYPNDADRLVTRVNRDLADGNNYQYANKPLVSDGFDPADIPILYMTGDYDFKFTESEVAHLHKYLTDGGTIIFNAARGRDEFSAAVAREMAKVFPQKKFMRLPPDHPVFNSKFRIRQVLTQTSGIQSSLPVEVYSMDIGTRAAAILVPMGLGASWTGTAYHAEGKHIVGEGAMRLGVNLVAYVLGSTTYSRFLAQQFPVYTDKTREGDRFRYALVRYSGSWDVNPGLQNSMLFSLHDNTKINVDFAPNVVALDEPALRNFPLVFMTGHYDFELTGKEAKGLAEYVERGGMVVASAAAGLKPFDTAFRREMDKAFPGNKMIKIPPTHPIFSAGWSSIDKVSYTANALSEHPDLDSPEFYGLFVGDRLAVLYTPYDLNSGLNGESNAYAKGIDTTDAQRISNNIITYALSH